MGAVPFWIIASEQKCVFKWGIISLGAKPVPLIILFVVYSIQLKKSSAKNNSVIKIFKS